MTEVTHQGARCSHLQTERKKKEGMGRGEREKYGDDIERRRESDEFRAVLLDC